MDDEMRRRVEELFNELHTALNTVVDEQWKAITQLQEKHDKQEQVILGLMTVIKDNLIEKRAKTPTLQ